MKILIRKVNTRLYMNSGEWMNNAGQAYDFKSGGDAITFAIEHHLADVEIIYAFPSQEYNFCTGMVGLPQPTEVSPVAPGRAYSPSP